MGMLMMVSSSSWFEGGSIVTWFEGGSIVTWFEGGSIATSCIEAGKVPRVLLLSSGFADRDG
jgi:hypothetical protein